MLDIIEKGLSEMVWIETQILVIFFGFEYIRRDDKRWM